MTIDPGQYLGRAYQFASRFKTVSESERAEILQDAAIGIITAASKFDPAKGPHFSTYAYWWMHSNVSRGRRERGQRVQVPDKIWRKLSRSGDLPRVASLSTPIRDRENACDDTLIDRLVAAGDSPEDLAAKREQIAAVRAALDRLPKRSRTILRMRFVFEQTLEQIGEVFKVSRERIRQIEVQALGKLRRQLEPYR